MRTLPRLPEAAGPVHGVARPADPADRDPGGPRLSLLVTGESTAVGVGVDTHEEGLAARIAGHLADGTGREVGWRVDGRNGARTRADGAHAWRRLPRPSGEHDVLIVVLGVNDTLGLTPPRHWRTQMHRLVEEATRCLRPGGLVIVAGIPRIDTFPALPQPLRAVLGAHGRVLDAATRDLIADAPGAVHVSTPPMVDDVDLCADGFHPSAHGYARWARRLHEEAVAPWADRHRTS